MKKRGFLAEFAMFRKVLRSFCGSNFFVVLESFVRDDFNPEKYELHEKSQNQDYSQISQMNADKKDFSRQGAKTQRRGRGF